MIPCKQNKCLLYPACRDKTIINCETLLRYIESKFKEDSKTEHKESVHHYIWIGLNVDFPMLTRVFPSPVSNVYNEQSPFIPEILLRFRERVFP